MKPRKLVMADEDLLPPLEAEEHYEASDYATTGSLDQLAREGQHGAVAQVLREHGHFMGDASTMDPMEILILMEEHGGYE
jgi:hypothetical protein